MMDNRWQQTSENKWHHKTIKGCTLTREIGVVDYYVLWFDNNEYITNRHVTVECREHDINGNVNFMLNGILYDYILNIENMKAEASNENIVNNKRILGKSFTCARCGAKYHRDGKWFSIPSPCAGCGFIAFSMSEKWTDEGDCVV